MDITPQQAAEALEQSIEYWKRLASGNRLDGEEMFEDWALCKLYPRKTACDGCPVKEATGYAHCVAGPWMSVYDVFKMHSDRFHPNTKVYDSQPFKNAAMTMVVFLESLRKPTT